MNIQERIDQLENRKIAISKYLKEDADVLDDSVWERAFGMRVFILGQLSSLKWIQSKMKRGWVPRGGMNEGSVDVLYYTEEI